MLEFTKHKKLLVDVLVKQHLFKNNIVTKQRLKDVCALMSISRKFYELINPLYQKAKEISQREFIFPGMDHQLFLSAKGHLFFTGGSHKWGAPEDEHIPKEVFPHGEKSTIKHCSSKNDYILTVSEEGRVREHTHEYIEIRTLSGGKEFYFPQDVIIHRCYAGWYWGLALSTDGRLFYIEHKEPCAKEIIFPHNISIKDFTIKYEYYGRSWGLALSTDGRLFYIEHKELCAKEIIFPHNISIKDFTIGSEKAVAISTESRLFTFSLKEKLPVEIGCPPGIRIKKCLLFSSSFLILLSTRDQLFIYTPDPNFHISEILLPHEERIEKCIKNDDLYIISKIGRLYRLSTDRWESVKIKEIANFPEGIEIEDMHGNLALSTEGRIFKMHLERRNSTIEEIKSFPEGFNLKRY